MSGLKLPLCLLAILACSSCKDKYADFKGYRVSVLLKDSRSTPIAQFDDALISYTEKNRFRIVVSKKDASKLSDLTKKQTGNKLSVEVLEDSLTGTVDLGNPEHDSRSFVFEMPPMTPDGKPLSPEEQDAVDELLAPFRVK